jgi:tetratricopeptide (TPR) repeat protein
MGTSTNTTGTALFNLGKYNESIAYVDKALAIEPANTHALSAKKLDLAGLSKTNIVAMALIPHASTGTPAIPPQSVFGYYAKTRTTNAKTTPPINCADWTRMLFSWAIQ